jgi:hypothetical protein
MQVCLDNVKAVSLMTICQQTLILQQIHFLHDLSKRLSLFQSKTYNVIYETPGYSLYRTVHVCSALLTHPFEADSI